jgi:RNA polymerase sigma factor (sigma-70 family)
MNRPVTPARTKAGRWRVDDEDLIQAAREGKEHAGPFLVSLYAPMLLGYARGLASDLGDSACEQICECAVERAVRKIDLYDPTKGDFAGWARSMLRYVALDYRRDNARLQSIDGLDLAEPETQSSREIPGGVTAALTEVVGQLSEPDQAILALREIEQLPSQTVAALLGISDAAVRQRYSRARQRLVRIAQNDQRLTSFLRGGPA